MNISPVVSGRHCFLGVAQMSTEWKRQTVSYESGFDLQDPRNQRSWGTKWSTCPTSENH
ncbi:hypothetical protein I79_006235 [Cricetulus griseus]|uniref:Uncharacterized protein n=1 Tax=Cricetulus griseus TaxID=10029 RepID=G3H7A5_CRIGR|nr:hypothetical protein I79_006235 [Cricetulus griseus]